MRRVFQSITPLRAATVGSSIVAIREVSCQTFGAAVKKTTEEFTKTKSKEAQASGKRLFETEILDDIDVTKGSTMSPAICTDIANAAAALKIRPNAGTIFPAVSQWALAPEIIKTLPAEPLSKLLHASVVLHSPALFDLLISYIWRITEMAPKLDPVSCAVIINAYGRSGVKHDVLYAALVKRATATIDDSAITLAHVANVAYATSRVGASQPALVKKLKAQFLKLKGNANPLIAASVLDSFTTAGALDDEVLSAVETVVTSNIAQCSAPLVASILNTLSKAKRTDSKLFEAAATRASQIASTFDSASIARTMNSLFISNVNNEDLMATLAERACKIPGDFRVAEARQTLEALSFFVLYDPELFPLLGSRVAAVIGSRGVFDVDHIAAILAAFAAVHERHEDLIHLGGRAIADSAQNLNAETYINALYSFAAHNVRNDSVRRTSEGAKANVVAMTAAAATSELLTKRFELVKKTYLDR
eukprot:GILI01044040.1.p1 GENE.GILI01044040.1~~GILI01044040.1.p1  ORF type:complete len:478 (+),score=129.13 GILI01044040.1:59-1492(+)